MKKLSEGKCPSGTCPSDRCANPELSFAERKTTHAANLPHARNKMVGRVGEWYCVVDGYIKWLPDPAKFDGATEGDRVEAAFDELVRRDLLDVARQARKDRSNPDEAVQRRRAAFDAVTELFKVVFETFESVEISTGCDNSRG